MSNSNMARKGEAHGRSKLKNEQVLKIVEAFDNGVSCTKLSKQFGVKEWHILRIVNGLAWTHITKLKPVC